MRTLRQILRDGTMADVTLCLIDHPDGPVRLFDGLGILEHEGEEWMGLGGLVSLAVTEFSTETQIADVTATLSGVDPEVAPLLETSLKGRLMTVWKAFLDERNRVIASYMILDAECDQITSQVGDDGTATITLTAVAGFYFLETQSAAVWDQQAQRGNLVALGIDPDSDTGFDLMHEMKNKNVLWAPS